MFSDAVVSHFGSGWVWLVKNTTASVLQVFATHDADNPLKHGLLPLVVCDAWEHAYYIDYRYYLLLCTFMHRNAKKSYVDAFWKVINWKFANENLCVHFSFFSIVSFFLL